MRKHFLILMLLTLLPLAGWAEPEVPTAYTGVTVELGAFSKTYDGHAANALPTVTVSGKKGDADAAVLTLGEDYNLVWTDPLGTAFANADGVVGAGEYTVQVVAHNEGDTFTAAATSSLTKTFTVTPKEIVYFLTGAQYSVGDTPDVTRHYSKTSGDFIGEDDLATYATFSFLDEDLAKFSLVAGKFSAIKTVNISSLKINWEAGVCHNYDFRFTSTANIVVTGKSIADFITDELDPAAYPYTGSQITPNAPALYPTVGDDALSTDYYTVSYGENINVGTAENHAGSITYTGKTPYEGTKTIYFGITPIDIPANAIQAPTAKDLTYNGLAQELVEGASVTGNIGTFQYLVSDEQEVTGNEDGWSAEIPTQQDAKAGINVYWKVIGDANHNTPAFAATQVVTAEVKKATLVAQAAEKTVFYTGAAPELGVTAIEYMGWVNNETADAVFTTDNNDDEYVAPTAAVAAEVATAEYAADVYPEGITVSGGNAKNYTIVPIGNKLTISKAKVKVTLAGGPDAANFGTEEAEKNSWSVKSDWVTVKKQVANNGNDNDYADANVADVLATTTTGTGTNAVTTLTGATLTRADHSLDAGSYALTLNGVAAKNTNYEIVTPYTYPTGDDEIKFTINAADWTVAATNKAKVYGEADPTLTATYPAGLTAEEKALFTITRTQNENVGIYDITVTGPEKIRGNAITYQKGVFAITKAPLTITIPNQTLYTGQTVSDLSITGVTVEGEKTINGVKDNAKDGLTLNVDLTEVVDPEISVDPQTKVLGITDQDANSGSADDVIVIGQIAQAISNNYEIEVVPGALKVVNTALALLLDQNDANLDVKIETAAAACEAYEPEGDDDPEELTYNVFFNTFKMNKKEWYAMVLPFATTPAELVSAFGKYVVVNKLTGASLEESGSDKVVNVTFQLEWDQIAAGEPFLIKAADDVDWADLDEPFVKSISSAINDVDKGAAIFTGVYDGDKSVKWGLGLDGTTADADAKYRWLDHKDIKGTNNWKNPKTNAHALLPMEAFLILDKEATKARIFVEDIENGATAIKSISADEINGLNVKGMYNLNGMKMNSVPTQKGVYIINGKKVVIK